MRSGATRHEDAGVSRGLLCCGQKKPRVPGLRSARLAVPKRGLEPRREYSHYALNVARLPIPPLRQAPQSIARDNMTWLRQHGQNPASRLSHAPRRSRRLPLMLPVYPSVFSTRGGGRLGAWTRPRPAQSCTAARGHHHGRPGPDPRRPRLGQDPRHRPPHRLPDRAGRRRALEHPGRHLHQQGRPRDARAPRRAARTERGTALTVGTFHCDLRPLAAPRRPADRASTRRFAIYDDGDQIDLDEARLQRARARREARSRRAPCSARSRARRASCVDAERVQPRTPRATGRERGAGVYTPLPGAARRENHALDFDDCSARRWSCSASARRSWSSTRSATSTCWWTSSRTPTSAQYELVRLLGDEAPQHLRRRRRGPVDLRLAHGRHPQHPATSSATSPSRRSCCWSRTTAPPRPILDVAERRHQPERPGASEKTLWTENDARRPVVLHEAYNERDEAQFVVREIERLTRDGARYGDVRRACTAPTPSPAPWKTRSSATACPTSWSAARASTSATRSRTCWPTCA